MPKSTTDTHIIPRNRDDFKRLLREAMLVGTVVAGAFGGATFAQDSKIERLEALTERQSAQINRLEASVYRLERKIREMGDD
jgi:hypothetical protein